MRKVLLTGGSGLLGKTLAPLLANTCDVTHFDTSDPADGLPVIEGDLRQAKALEAACRGMDAVVHVAALHGRTWQTAGDDVGFEVNVTGTKNVLEASARAGIRRVVFASSIWATGHGNPPVQDLPIDETLTREPAELYGLTKQLGESMCRYASSRYGISTIVLRPGGIRPAPDFGPLQPCYLAGCVDVRDVAQAHLLALDAPEGIVHDVFIITAESPLCRVSRQDYAADPVAALDAIVPGVADRVRAGELQLPGANAEWYSVAKAKRMLGYRPEFNFQLA